MISITKNTERLKSGASQFTGLRDRINRLGSDLDAAMRSARRGDVPELGQIEGTYGPLRSRISNAAVTMDIQARDLRFYADNSETMEQRSMWLLRTSNVPYVTPGVTASAPKFDLDAFVHGLVDEPAWYTLKRITEVTPTGGVTAAIRGFSRTIPLLSFLDGVIKWRSAGNQERVGIGLSWASIGVQLAADFDALLVGGGVRAVVSSRLALWASRGPYIAAGYAIGTPIGNYYREWFESNRAKGVSNVDAISQQNIPGVAGAAVKSGELGLLAVDVGSAKLGEALWNRYYNVEDYKPDVLLDNHKIAVVLAGFRQQYPLARIWPQDGRYTIIVPATIEMPAHQFTFDNKTGRLVP